MYSPQPYLQEFPVALKFCQTELQSLELLRKFSVLAVDTATKTTYALKSSTSHFVTFDPKSSSRRKVHSSHLKHFRQHNLAFKFGNQNSHRIIQCPVLMFSGEVIPKSSLESPQKVSPRSCSGRVRRTSLTTPHPMADRPVLSLRSGEERNELR